MKVFVYYNLTKKVWSIKALEGDSKGLVVGHAKALSLANVTPKVSLAGRKRVLIERQKNVHAGLVGTLSAVSAESNLASRFESLPVTPDGLTPVTYNPYVAAYFTLDHDRHTKFVQADYAYFTPYREVLCGGKVLLKSKLKAA